MMIMMIMMNMMNMIVMVINSGIGARSITCNQSSNRSCRERRNCRCNYAGIPLFISNLSVYFLPFCYHYSLFLIPHSYQYHFLFLLHISSFISRHFSPTIHSPLLSSLPPPDLSQPSTKSSFPSSCTPSLKPMATSTASAASQPFSRLIYPLYSVPPFVYSHSPPVYCSENPIA